MAHSFSWRKASTTSFMTKFGISWSCVSLTLVTGSKCPTLCERKKETRQSTLGNAQCSDLNHVQQLKQLIMSRENQTWEDLCRTFQSNLLSKKKHFWGQGKKHTCRCSSISFLSYVIPLGVMTGSLRISKLIFPHKWSGTSRFWNILQQNNTMQNHQTLYLWAKNELIPLLTRRLSSTLANKACNSLVLCSCYSNYDS